MMNITEKNYLFLILLHVGIGMLIYFLTPLSIIYGFAMFFAGIYLVITTKNQNHENLLVCAYIVGSEVFLRMTGGNPLYEFSKYGVIFFIILGMYFKGFSKHAVPYWIFLALLIPGLVLATYTLDYGTNLRKTISFNISGPVCLGIAALYTYNRRLTLQQLNNILLTMALPIISCTIYLIFYTPNIRDVITGTGSSFETSGGFGPNQVSTILGLGMFIFFSRVILSSPTRFLFIVNLVTALAISYRCLVTFSRGGTITGIVMIIVLLMVTYLKINRRGRQKLALGIGFLLIAMMGVWVYSSQETGGLIEKRYANQDAAGRVKESLLTGRERIFASEINYFLSNPIFGIGVAKSVELRKDATGLIILSHNELSRMLAEHGAFGIMALLILFATPLFLYLDNKDNIFLLCFLLFWLLTINHAAMRLAAPAFVYALSILKIQKIDTPSVHRE